MKISKIFDDGATFNLTLSLVGTGCLLILICAYFFIHNNIALGTISEEAVFISTLLTVGLIPVAILLSGLYLLVIISAAVLRQDEPDKSKKSKHSAALYISIAGLVVLIFGTCYYFISGGLYLIKTAANYSYYI